MTEQTKSHDSLVSCLQMQPAPDPSEESVAPL